MTILILMILSLNLVTKTVHAENSPPAPTECREFHLQTAQDNLIRATQAEMDQIDGIFINRIADAHVSVPQLCSFVGLYYQRDQDVIYDAYALNTAETQAGLSDPQLFALSQQLLDRSIRPLSFCGEKVSHPFPVGDREQLTQSVREVHAALKALLAHIKSNPGSR